jgi:hypothetical protein
MFLLQCPRKNVPATGSLRAPVSNALRKSNLEARPDTGVFWIYRQQSFRYDTPLLSFKCESSARLPRHHCSHGRNDPICLPYVCISCVDVACIFQHNEVEVEKVLPWHRGNDTQCFLYYFVLWQAPPLISYVDCPVSSNPTLTKYGRHRAYTPVSCDFLSGRNNRKKRTRRRFILASGSDTLGRVDVGVFRGENVRRFESCLWAPMCCSRRKRMPLLVLRGGDAA